MSKENDPIYKLWSYNNWATTSLISTLSQETDVIPPVCLNLLSHIVNAQMIWTSRIKGIIPVVGVWDKHTLDECTAYHNESSAALGKIINDYNGDGLIPVNYANTKGDEFQNFLLDILLHIFNHGTYHRAQIAKEMKGNGLEPINTDYITFARK